MRKLVWTLLALVVAVPLQAEERWDLSAARVSMRFSSSLMRDLGIKLAPAVGLDRDGNPVYEVGTEGQLVALAPGSVFRQVDMGELQLADGPSLSWKGDAATLVGALLVPGAEPHTFTIRGADGSPLFFADHTHFSVDRAARSMRLFNMDLRLSPELAERLGEPRHAGLAVGVLEVRAAAGIPRGAVEQPLGGCTTPQWGNPHNDVSLIILGNMQQRDRGNGLVAITPSATLKNVGATDVVWQQKFLPPVPPYNNDQHPYLIWNMYRVSNGRLEQIGVSGMKHAFVSTNTNCGCGGGHILWVGAGGCEDTYGVGNNDSPGDVGPRSEVTAHTGVWQRCGSVFDVNCDGVQNSVPGMSGAGDSRRLSVLETDLQTAGAQYFFEGWYVVRDDVNIFNTMAYRTVTPTFAGSTWSFTPFGPHTLGPMIDAWIDPAVPNAEKRRVSTSRGHLTLAVKATDLGAGGGGRWRYDYALMNHDYDDGIASFSVPLPAGAVVTNTFFHDVDRVSSTDWLPTVSPGAQIRWQPPNANARMRWGQLYSFGFEVNAAPTTSAAGTTVKLGVPQGLARGISVNILGPTP